MKEIKFTRENAIRHFRHDFRKIVTTRDEIKAEKLGESFIIKHPDGTELIYILYNVERTDYTLLNHFPHANIWKCEGFESREEFLIELKRLYPKKQELYIHWFKLLGVVS